MASPGKRHCAICIGTRSFSIILVSSHENPKRIERARAALAVGIRRGVVSVAGSTTVAAAAAAAAAAGGGAIVCKRF